MTTSQVVRVSAEFPQKKAVIAECSAQGPMSQQNAGSNGHEMHPQKFVRLVGCRESNVGQHEGAHRPR
jgi:hypothetical protein